MEFYEVINKRRTIRQFDNKPVPQDALERILNAGLQAPSSDHMRDWELVVITNKEQIKAIAEIVKSYPCTIQEPKNPQQEMFKIAFPRQQTMLAEAGCIVLPYFHQRTDLFKSQNVFGLINYGATWALIENILLSSTNEGMGCAIHVPVGNEADAMAQVVGTPEGYVLPCIIGIGYPSADAMTPTQEKATTENKVRWNKW